MHSVFYGKSGVTQPLAILIKLLQRFIVAHKITVRGFMKLHVLDALMRQLLIFIFKYLLGIFFSVDDILQIVLRCLQLFYTGLKICNHSKKTCQTTTRYS
jgi:hypothetical protein